MLPGIDRSSPMSFKRKGQFLATSPLQPTSTATSVRVREGKRLVTDGPFAETREHLGGYFLVDAKRSGRGDRHRGPDSRGRAWGRSKSARWLKSRACRWRGVSRPGSIASAAW